MEEMILENMNFSEKKNRITEPVMIYNYMFSVNI